MIQHTTHDSVSNKEFNYEKNYDDGNSIETHASVSRLLVSILRSECDGTRWRTGGEVKGKLANGVSTQYSHTTSQRGVSSITNADAHTSAASSRLNW